MMNVSTVWKFRDFSKLRFYVKSILEILRKSAKFALTQLDALNYDFREFLHF